MDLSFLLLKAGSYNRANIQKYSFEKSGLPKSQHSHFQFLRKFMENSSPMHLCIEKQLPNNRSTFSGFTKPTSRGEAQ
jgi:hypothetical protein